MSDYHTAIENLPFFSSVVIYILTSIVMAVSPLYYVNLQKKILSERLTKRKKIMSYLTAWLFLLYGLILLGFYSSFSKTALIAHGLSEWWALLTMPIIIYYFGLQYNEIQLLAKRQNEPTE